MNAPALGNGSRQIFESLGVWNAMAADARFDPSTCPTPGVSAWRASMRASGVPAFGGVVPNRTIGRAVAGLREAPITLLVRPR
jgi:hypothetical protein